MPIQKDLKRLVRARMQKTGESYTAARARLLEKKPARSAVSGKTSSKERSKVPSGDLAALAGMTDAAVAAKTQRTWKQWVAELDRLGAAARPHAEIARHLRTELGLPSWWAQMVTVGYERIRGLRAKGQRRDGGYDVHKSKVYPVPLAELWTAFVRCEAWLGDTKLRMSKATRHKSLRLRWSDGAPIEVNFAARSPTKSQLQLQHNGLATREEAARLRAFWTERLGKLGEVLRRT